MFYLNFSKNLIKKILTAILTPINFSIKTGHFRSSLNKKALTKEGKPLPWYTYPAIDFLVSRNFESSSVLEFGGGQSSAFWSIIAKTVLTFETDKLWIKEIK